MGLEWYMIPDEFTQARMKPEWIRLSLYGTYKTNKLIHLMCIFLGNQEDIVIEFRDR